MNTRSLSASRKHHMTVGFPSRDAESTSCVDVSQSNVDIGVIDENSSGESDLKKTPDDSYNVDEEELNRRCKSNDQVFEGKEDSTFSCGVTTRSSSRPGKRPRTVSPHRSLSTTPEPPKSGKRLKGCSKPQKRQWESWGAKEKDGFFEALLEHSKDFDKIHNHLLNGHKRRGDLSSVVKNKDQVRHFYYRTLNKISKYIPEPKDNVDSKKTYHEVRSVICYGELRKKLHSLKIEKDGKKLTELISTGKTTVRHHGRNLNIRTPVCRALKRLSSNVAVEEPVHVPNKIMVELVPKDNQTWSTIQGLAKNPRLRTTVSSRKSLYSFLMFLISKWKLCGNTNITLSPSLPSSHPKLVTSKWNEVESITPTSKLCEGNNNCTEELERVSDSCDAVKYSSDTTCTVITQTINVTTSNVSNENKVVNYDFECSGDRKEENPDRSDIDNAVYQETWDMSNCSNVTIADVYRKLGHARKLSFCYSLSTEEPNISPLLTCHALEHLVKLAAGEFSSRTDVKNGNKKEPINILSKAKSVSKDSTSDVKNGNKREPVNILSKAKSVSKDSSTDVKNGNKREPVNILSKAKSVSKDSTTDVKNGNKKEHVNILSKGKSVSKDSTTWHKPNKAPRSMTKSAVKPPKLAPKPFQEPSLVVPSGVPSVLHQVSTSASSKSGNHLTFGFTPINSVQNLSPFLPKMKKSRKSRVVVQRTLLPRPTAPGSFVPSPPMLVTPHQDGLNIASTHTSVTTLTQSQSCNPPGEGQIEPMETNDITSGQDSPPYREFTLPSSSSHNPSSDFSVDSLINLALEPDENVEKLLSSKSVRHSSSSSGVGRSSKIIFVSETIDGNVRTEEIDCGVAGGGRTPKEMRSLTEAIEHLDNGKESEHTRDLLDNLRSSEDDDPFKLLSPSDNQHFHTETWLNEESSDFSLSNLFGNMEGSPSKQKNSNILDTPKKNQSDVKVTECHDSRENASKYSHPGQVFGDIVDESSVDYVKKFRDLAKKMTNDSEIVSNSFDIADSTPPSSSNTTVSFKALLSDATSRN